MAEYVEIEQAIKMPGLRVVVPAGNPGPWGEAIKGVLHVKKIPYLKVRHDRGDYSPLLRWTLQSSAPVLVYNDERPRSVWNDQLHLAERLQAAPLLIPAALEDRVRMFGLCDLLAGENGFGWTRRLMLVQAMQNDAGADETARKGSIAFGNKYGYSPEAAAAAPAKCAEIIATVARHLERQQALGSRYLVGDRLSAADVYWAAFAALVRPLPDELCPMFPRMRKLYYCADPLVCAATTPQLLEHRDFIYRQHLELPVDL
ncbi:MAG TPA: glutathione binding-like protein [Candidatus Binataceae bacterium]|nr:glutathione binding-like protein [Candidatus Binataceae bacterium]